MRIMRISLRRTSGAGSVFYVTFPIRVEIWVTPWVPPWFTSKVTIPAEVAVVVVVVAIARIVVVVVVIVVGAIDVRSLTLRILASILARILLTTTLMISRIFLISRRNGGRRR